MFVCLSASRYPFLHPNNNNNSTTRDCHQQWGFFNNHTTFNGTADVANNKVMGGVSESGLRVVPGAGEPLSNSDGAPAAAAAVFAGEVKTSNSGGFVSVRTRNASPPLDLSAYDGLRLRVKGDGNRYKFSM